MIALVAWPSARADLSQRRMHLQLNTQSVAVLHQGMRAKTQFRPLAGGLAQQLGLRVGGACMGVVAPDLTLEVSARAAAPRRVLRSEALVARPGLHQRSVHRKVLRGQ